jgi:translation initiation factor 2 subunit 1
MPEEDELVLCTVTKIHFNSVFAKLDEYDKTGMIHISEISPGRIRNIRDYVVEGKKVICKVLRIDKVKGHIDLSLRRVNEGQRRRKNEEIKSEQRAEKIIEGLAKQLNLDLNVVYEEVAGNVFKKYEYIHQSFKDVVEKDLDLINLGIKKNIAEALTKIIKEKIKPPSVQIKGELKITLYDPNGVEIVKQALSKAKNKDIIINYKGAGKYNIIVTAPDYKQAEKILKQKTESVIKFVEKKKGVVSFEREEK